MLPITVRTRKEGDKIELIGGTKKVSDLLIDKKSVSLSGKDFIS